MRPLQVIAELHPAIHPGARDTALRARHASGGRSGCSAVRKARRAPPRYESRRRRASLSSRTAWRRAASRSTSMRGIPRRSRGLRARAQKARAREVRQAWAGTPGQVCAHRGGYTRFGEPQGRHGRAGEFASTCVWASVVGIDGCLTLAGQSVLSAHRRRAIVGPRRSV